MLKRFEVSNFRGFNDPLIMDFSRIRNYDFNTLCVRNGLINKALVFGKNGTGKSNLGLALFDITLHLTDMTKDSKLVSPLGYINLDSGKDCAYFRYDFVFDGEEIVYSYKKRSPFDLVEERLDINGEHKINVNYSDLSKIMVDLDGIKDLDFTKIKDNHISIIKYIYANSPANANKYITKMMDFVKGMLWFCSLNEGNKYSGFTVGVESLDMPIIKNDKVKELSSFLKKNNVDLDLIVKEEMGQKRIYAKFKYGALPLSYLASSGTSALWLFFYWKLRFEAVTFLFMDEFDAFYHYETAELVEELVKQNEKIQAIMTTHNTSLMNNQVTRPDCCFLLSGGEIKSLIDCTDKEIREGHNLEKMYHNGAFNE